LLLPCLQQQPPSNSKAIADRQFFSEEQGKPTNLSTYLFRAISIGLASPIVSPDSADESQEWSARHFLSQNLKSPAIGSPLVRWLVYYRGGFKRNIPASLF
jgi:hypothetical protein